MRKFETMRLPPQPVAVALDGSDVRGLLAADGGTFAHLELGPGQTSRAVTHKSIDEIYYFLGGRGEMWRRQDAHEETVPVDAGTCLTVPARTDFQFRAYGFEPLAMLVVAMPPWPGGDEAVEVTGPWEPTVSGR